MKVTVESKNVIPDALSDLVIDEDGKIALVLDKKFNHDNYDGHEEDWVPIIILHPEELKGRQISYGPDSFKEDFKPFHGKITLEQ